MIYTVLPLDEPTFDIDANTRTIAVPNDFKKNGISVQGDQVSEIIYFTIDRYVDAMDLYRDDVQIVIQWETAPSVSTSKAASVSDKGISIAYLKDISLFKTEGKMLFGWALNSNITKNAGAIKFSVRFYKLNGQKELDFSFSTLTATATIQPGLDYTWQAGSFAETVFDDSIMIKGRIKDSVQPDDAGEADPPAFLEGLDLPSAFAITRTDAEGKEVNYKAIDLEKITDSTGDVVLQRDFIVQATGEGYISYEWKKASLDDDTTFVPIETDAGFEYVLTDDTNYSGEKLYYTKEVTEGIESYKTFSIAPGSIGSEIPADIKATLYERVGYCKAKTTGIYVVKVRNKVGLASAYLEDSVLVPGPDEDTFEVSLPEGQELSVYLTDGAEGAGMATIKVLGKTAVVDVVENGEVKKPGDTIVYTWTQGETTTEPIEIRNVENAVAQEYSIPGVAAEDRAQYDEDITASIYATRNGDNTKVITKVFRVTDKAHAPIVELGPKLDFKVQNGNTVNITATVTNYADIKHNGKGDEITFEWYKAVFNGDDTAVDPLANDELIINPVMNVSEDGVCTLTFDTLTTAVEGSELAKSGAYYCVVTNKVNDSTAANDLSTLTIDNCIGITVGE